MVSRSGGRSRRATVATGTFAKFVATRARAGGGRHRETSGASRRGNASAHCQCRLDEEAGRTPRGASP
eukprot:3558110-Prymnesium_polylepis.1